MAKGDDSGTSTPTTAPAAPAGDDLDFSDLKKKKKSSKKKAAFDLEAFEKELNESKSKGDDDEDEVEENPNLDNIDEAELGDDPFAQADAPTAEGGGGEAWLKSDRDYTYPEVCCIPDLVRLVTSPMSQLLTRFYSLLHAANPSLLSTSSGKRYTIAPPSIHREGNKRSIFANVTDICKKMHRQVRYSMASLSCEAIQRVISPNTLYNSCSLKWVPPAVSTVPVASSSKVVSSKSKSRTFCGGILVSSHRQLIRFAQFSLCYSRVRHLQDLQIPRHPPHKGESYLLHVMRVLWKSS